MEFVSHRDGLLGFIVSSSVYATLCGMSALNSIKLGMSMGNTLIRRRYLE